IIDTEGRVERFMRKYGMAEDQQADAGKKDDAKAETKAAE
ncbi:MAG: 50S ribosomal protein L31, partial [Thermosynechococcaceae cyanobacterium]